VWYIYIVRCCDDTLYTGVTTCVERRVIEHNTKARGAKYTKSRRPVFLEYVKEAKDRSSALKEEARIKKLSRKNKLLLIGEK